MSAAGQKNARSAGGRRTGDGSNGERPIAGDGTPEARPAVTLGERIAWIWRFWRPHRGFLVFLVIFTLVSSAVTIAYPLVFKVVLDLLFKGSSGTAATGPVKGLHLPMPSDLGNPATATGATLHRVLLILLVIAAGRFVAGFYPSFRAWMNLKIDVDVRETVFRKILQKDFRFFNRFGTGDLVTRLMDDISEYPKIAWFSCSGIFRAVDAASRLVFCILAMFFLDWKLALLSLFPLPIMLYIIYRVRTKLTEAAGAQQKMISRTNDMLEKTFSGIRIVKAFTAEPGQARALGRILHERIDTQYRVQKLWASITTLDTVASRIGQVVVLGVGGVMVVRGEITLGSIYAFYIYLDMLVQPMWDLPNLIVTSRQAFVCVDREEELMHFPVAIEHAAEGAPLPAVEALEFDRVGFGYDGGRPVVEEVSFTVRRGETVAIVGPVASGKSTLLKLAAGLLRPDHGVIRVNQKPLSSYSWNEFRSKVGYTPQDSLLFSESIRENVSMGRPESQDGWVGRVLTVAQMDKELEQLPQGVETVLGQKGSKVSGGQRQRISIARALYGGPEILLLDDCTASLDADNEDRLWSQLRAVLPQTTVLLVSHRLATIRRAGRILVLDHGRLTDQGTHEQLAGRCEIYRRFLERVEERERVSEPCLSESGDSEPGADGVKAAPAGEIEAEEAGV